MRLYYDISTGKPLHTFDGDPEIAPLGDFVEVSGPIKNLESVTIENGQAVISNLVPIRKDHISMVNTRINDIREKFITPISAQDMIYMEKEKEAKAYVLADPEPTDLSEFPFIASEVGYTADTSFGVAQVYLNLGAQWRTIAAQLENARIGYISQIEQAQTRLEIETLYEAFHNQMSVFG